MTTILIVFNHAVNCLARFGDKLSLLSLHEGDKDYVVCVPVSVEFVWTLAYLVGVLASHLRHQLVQFRILRILLLTNVFRCILD